MVELLSFIVAILLLVTIHEWGHYFVARRAGVAIEKFSIGFGQPLIKWHNRDGVEFCIAMIPLGGYVKMRGEYAIATAEHQHQAEVGSFAATPLRWRMAIVAAGPLVNLFFAWVVFSAFELGTVTLPAPKVAQPPVQSLLANIGLHDGDTITVVNGKPIRHFGEVQNAAVDALLSRESLHLQWRDAAGVVHDASAVAVDAVHLDDVDWQRRLGLALYQPQATIARVQADSPAAQAGLRSGDVLLGLNGAVTSGNAVLTAIHEHPNQAVNLLVQRQNERFSVSLTPRADTLPSVQPSQASQVIGRIGIEIDNDVATLTERRGLLQALSLGLNTTADQVSLNLKGLVKMATGQLSIKNIGGPVTIAKQAGNSIHSGITQFIGFLAVLSVALGTLNLLPIPVLDGGHLLYYVAEWIRGKPLPERVLVAGQKIGLVLLLLLMGIAFFNDAHWLIKH